MNGVVRESVLDHVYVKDFHFVTNLIHSWPVFGDHAAVIFDTQCDKMKKEESVRRDWKGYNAELLRSKLSLNSKIVNI